MELQLWRAMCRRQMEKIGVKPCLDRRGRGEIASIPEPGGAAYDHQLSLHWGGWGGWDRGDGAEEGVLWEPQGAQVLGGTLLGGRCGRVCCSEGHNGTAGPEILEWGRLTGAPMRLVTEWDPLTTDPSDPGKEAEEPSSSSPTVERGRALGEPQPCPPIHLDTSGEMRKGSERRSLQSQEVWQQDAVILASPGRRWRTAVCFSPPLASSPHRDLIRARNVCQAPVNNGNYNNENKSPSLAHLKETMLPPGSMIALPTVKTLQLSDSGKTGTPLMDICGRLRSETCEGYALQCVWPSHSLASSMCPSGIPAPLRMATVYKVLVKILAQMYGVNNPKKVRARRVDVLGRKPIFPLKDDLSSRAGIGSIFESGTSGLWLGQGVTDRAFHAQSSL
ncbi:hypothetical protein JZ751_013169 [Albula glossodonta]|uniref:Uncharacterized protein n=1 Tax=Albula glossodonta TaxID=121402 RepID=A0A8T2P2D9_9TELE|nr:hypothetical protein JZ751_013169 [Albula glossodonta]